MRVVLETKLSDADAALYDAFVDDANGAHFSQTRAWAPLATAGRSLSSAWLLVQDGSQPIAAAHVLRPTLGLLRAPTAWVERGPVCRAPEMLDVVLPLVRKALQKRAIGRVAVMPYFAADEKITAEKLLVKNQFRNVQTPSGAHVRTLRLDLRNKNADEIFAGGDRQALRRKLKQAEKAGVRARLARSSDVTQLASLHSEMMTAQGKPRKSPAYFLALEQLLAASDRGALFLAEHETKAIAAALVMLHGALATFVIGATTTRPLPFSKMASAMAAAISWAHAKGAAWFDLGGIPAQNDADVKRMSIAQFKLDFTKNVVDLTAEHARWF